MSSKRSALASICQKYGVTLMYLFGSQRGVALQIIAGQSLAVTDPLADIDVGVVFGAPLPQGRARARLYSFLFNDLEDIFAPHATDLVLLEENHSVFQSEAVLGTCVYAATAEAKDAYEEAILRRASDFRPFLEQYYQELLEAKVSG